MYQDREWRIPQASDSPIRWPGAAANFAVFSPYCCGWHVTGFGDCYTDPMGLLVVFGNDWEWMALPSIEQAAADATNDGLLTASGVVGVTNEATFSL